MNSLEKWKHSGNERGCGIATTWKGRDGNEEHSPIQDRDDCGKEKLCKRSRPRGHCVSLMKEDKMVST